MKTSDVLLAPVDPVAALAVATAAQDRLLHAAVAEAQRDDAFRKRLKVELEALVAGKTRGRKRTHIFDVDAAAFIDGRLMAKHPKWSAIKRRGRIAELLGITPWMVRERLRGRIKAADRNPLEDALTLWKSQHIAHK